MGKKQSKKKALEKKPRNKAVLGVWLFLGGLGAWAILSSVHLESFFTKPPSGDKISKGAQLFAENCASCHGSEGIGEDPLRSKGGTKDNGVYLAPALNGTGHTWHHPDNALFHTIKNGSPAENSPMKGFAGRLSDEEIYSIIDYFKSLWPEKIKRMHSQGMHHRN